MEGRQIGKVNVPRDLREASHHQPRESRDADRVLDRPAVDIRDIRVDFVQEGARTQAIADISLSVAAGEFVAIVGPSGCGKSTLLNVVASLLAPTRGSVEFSGPPAAIGYVFQQDALLPWRRAIDNVTLALEIAGVKRKVARPRARAVMEGLALGEFAEHWPHQLSGGMRKRVSLAAALVHEPNVLLMDEPYSALDAQTRILLQDEVLALWRRERQTVLLVTHDLEEAVAMADRVVVLSARPTTIRRVLPVNLPRDRQVIEARAYAEFHELISAIWDDLRADSDLPVGRLSETRRHA